MKAVIDPQKAIPVLVKADVLVASGGLAGTAAVLSVKDEFSLEKLDVKHLQDSLCRYRCSYHG